MNGKSGIDDTRDVVGWLSKSSDSSDDIFCEIEMKKRMKEEEKKGEKREKGEKNRNQRSEERNAGPHSNEAAWCRKTYAIRCTQQRTMSRRAFCLEKSIQS